MKKEQIPTLSTPRLKLRPLSAADGPALHRIFCEKDMVRYFPNPALPSRQRVDKLIAQQLAHWEEHGYGWWAMTLKETGALLGWSGLRYLPETQEVEVAYMLSRSYWRRGLATEAAQACLNYGLETLGLTEVVGIVHPENIASQRVLEKIGMRLTAETCYFDMPCYRYSFTSPKGL